VTIAVCAGDGVGPDVMAEALKVLNGLVRSDAIDLAFERILIGGAAIDAYGTPLRDEDVERARSADAVLLSAVGGPKWDNPRASVRPEQGLLKIRKSLGLYANLRPVAVSDALVNASPIKADVLKGTDLLIVRELTGGIYFGRPSRQWRERRGRVAVDTLVYREHEIERVVRLAFDYARNRSGRLTSVDKANVLTSSRLWRSIVTEVAFDYPDVTLQHMLVDAMAMKLVQEPSRYDVIVTENMFGDILTDEASVLGGSLGMLPSASLGVVTSNGMRFGLYEPIHGSAPDIAGQGKANPAGMILSAALMLRMSLGLDDQARRIELAVHGAIADGVTTPDLGGSATTASFGDEVLERL
jgi:3-isopropylmalate dehydrogenase